MARKRVVCSFDYTNDKNYYHLLTAWNENPYIDFYISDCTPREIQTDSVDMIKNVLSRKIGEANYMVVIVGKHSNEIHKDYLKIGYRNWQAYEIAKNIEKGKGLVVVKLDSFCIVPKEVYNANAEFVTGFDKDKIKTALDRLANKNN